MFYVLEKFINWGYLMVIRDNNMYLKDSVGLTIYHSK